MRLTLKNNFLSSATLLPIDSLFHKLIKQQLFDRSPFPKIKPCSTLDTRHLSVYSKNQMPELTGLKDEQADRLTLLSHLTDDRQE